MKVSRLLFPILSKGFGTVTFVSPFFLDKLFYVRFGEGHFPNIE